MYLIGIDYGHGETTASYIDTDDPSGKVERLHILDGNSAESCKVMSAVCRDEATGEWHFVRDISDISSPRFTLHFKDSMGHISPGNKEAFAAFVKLVFDHILKNQDFLHYDPATGDKNFMIYAACPSGWDQLDGNQIEEYKEFLSGIIPVEWVIKESDAAYFKFKAEKKFPDKSVLVIDIGSSTIDFTAYGNGAVKTLSDGRRHGASEVERSIFRHFNSHNEDFKSAKAEAMEAGVDIDGHWTNTVLFWVKSVKEDFYRSEALNLMIDLSNGRIKYNLRKRVFDNARISNPELENTILARYRQVLTEDMTEVKNNIGSPEIVILTGGASRMPWLQYMVRDIFSDSKVFRDNDPSYVVSDGIAYYAAAIFKLKGEIRSAVDEFNREFTDSTLEQMIFDYFNEALRAQQLPKIRGICDSFNRGELKFNSNDFKILPELTYFDGLTVADGRSCTAAFLPAMIRHNNSIIRDTSGTITREINARLNEKIAKRVSERLSTAFRNALHGFVPQISISPDIRVNLSDLQINSKWDVDLIEEMTKTIYADFFCDGDPYKDRTSESARKKFSEPFYQQQESAKVNLPADMMQYAVSSLRSYLDSKLRPDYLLGKCIFAIY